MTTLRRDFLAFTAGAVAARTVLPAVAKAQQPVEHPDAALLRLDRDLAAAQVAIAAYCKLPFEQKNDEGLAAVMAQAHAAVDQIGITAPATLDGLIVHARAVDWRRSGEPLDPEVFGSCADAMLAAGIVRALLAMAGGAT